MYRAPYASSHKKEKKTIKKLNRDILTAYDIWGGNSFKDTSDMQINLKNNCITYSFLVNYNLCTLEVKNLSKRVRYVL